MNGVMWITLIACLIFLCGYMSVGEASVSSVSVPRAQAWAGDDPVRQRLVDWELTKRQRVIITILVTHNILAVAVSSFATVFTTSVWGDGALVWCTVVVSVLMVLFSDFLPKCIGMAFGERTFPTMLPILRGISTVITPVVDALENVVGYFSRAFGVDMTLESSIVTRNEIEQIVSDSAESGVIEETERRMIDGVISFDETRVSEIMLPRISVDAFEASSLISEVLPKIHEWEHSRIPVYEEDIDHIVGVIYVKDLIPYLREKHLDVALDTFMRQPLFVPGTMKVDALFDIMRKKHVHFAVVVDEYGGTAGIITLEDLLEEIVGEIRDEYDEESAPFIKIGDNSFRVKCAEPLEDLGNFVGYDFDCDDVDSVGGYVLDRFNGFPKKGDTFTDGVWSIKVTDVGEHRVNEVVFTRLVSESSD